MPGQSHATPLPGWDTTRRAAQGHRPAGTAGGLGTPGTRPRGARWRGAIAAWHAAENPAETPSAVTPGYTRKLHPICALFTVPLLIKAAISLWRGRAGLTLLGTGTRWGRGQEGAEQPHHGAPPATRALRPAPCVTWGGSSGPHPQGQEVSQARWSTHREGCVCVCGGCVPAQGA